MKKFKFLKTEAWPLNRWKMYVDSENIDKETDKIVSTLISVGTFINNCLDTRIEKEFSVRYGKKYVLKSDSKQDIIFPEEVKNKKFGKIFETLFSEKWELEYFYIRFIKSSLITECIFNHPLHNSKIKLRFSVKEKDGEITEGWVKFVKTIFGFDTFDNNFQKLETGSIVYELCPYIELMKTKKFENALIDLI